MKVSLILLIVAVFTQAQLPAQTPVIGIFTQTNDAKTTYIAASYVKFIEMSGAQVVPIYSFSPTTQVLSLLSKINGVLFPGGTMDLNIKNLWTQNAEAIFNYAKQQNDQGNKFPIFATCLGIQLVSYLTSNYNNNIISRVHGDDAIVLPINLVSDGYIFSTFSNSQK